MAAQLAGTAAHSLASLLCADLSGLLDNFNNSLCVNSLAFVYLYFRYVLPLWLYCLDSNMSLQRVARLDVLPPALLEWLLFHYPDNIGHAVECMLEVQPREDVSMPPWPPLLNADVDALFEEALRERNLAPYKTPVFQAISTLCSRSPM